MSSKDPSVFGLSLPASLAGYGESSVSAQNEVLRLFDECAPGLRRYVGAFGLTVEVTEDVVQEVFLQLFRHLQLGRSRANLRGWIFRVGHNLALKHRLTVARRHRWEGTWDVSIVDHVIDPAANPEQQLADDRRWFVVPAGHASVAIPRVSLADMARHGTAAARPLRRVVAYAGAGPRTARRSRRLLLVDGDELSASAASPRGGGPVGDDGLEPFDVLAC